MVILSPVILPMASLYTENNINMQCEGIFFTLRFCVMLDDFLYIFVDFPQDILYNYYKYVRTKGMINNEQLGH